MTLDEFKALIDRVSHAGPDQSHIHLVRRRMLLVCTSAFAVLGVVLNFAVLLLVPDVLPMAMWIQLGANVLVLLAPIILWRSGSLLFAGWVFILTLWGSMLSVSIIDGTFNAPAVPLFLLLPAVAALMVGSRSAVLVAELVGLTFVFLYWLEGSGISLPAAKSAPVHNQLALVDLLVATVALFIMIQGFVWIYRSVSDNLARAKQDAEIAVEAKAAFLATVSHEIRTPLNGMLGMAAALQKSDLNADQRQNVDVISESGEALMAIINDILDLSKIDAHKVEVEKVAFDPREALHSSVRIIEAKLEEQGLTYREQIDLDLPTHLVGDPARLRQIFINLLGNAVKFTEAGTISVRMINQRMSATSVDLRVEITDTGIGIPADRIDGVFKEFEQGDTSVNRKYGGTGLGLAICRRLVSVMGGEIGVLSELGQGTTFWFTLTLDIAEPSDFPAQEAREAFDPIALRDRLEDSDLLILVVDDNEINRKVIESLLTPYCQAVDMVSSGPDAIAAVKQRAYDLILMDVQMPVMDGIETANIIRTLASGSPHVPVIAITANAFDSDREKYLSNGFDDFVSKPINLDKLLAAMLRQLDRIGEGATAL